MTNVAATAPSTWRTLSSKQTLPATTPSPGFVRSPMGTCSWSFVIAQLYCNIPTYKYIDLKI